MTARFVTIAEAVKDRIAGLGALPSGVVPERAYRIPTLQKGKSPALRVIVIPQAWNPGEQITRASRLSEYTIQVILWVDLDPANEVAEADAVTAVMDAIVTALEDPIGSARLDRVEIPALYDDDQSRERVFLTGINAIYREATP